MHRIDARRSGATLAPPRARYSAPRPSSSDAWPAVGNPSWTRFHTVMVGTFAALLVAHWVIALAAFGALAFTVVYDVRPSLATHRPAASSSAFLITSTCLVVAAIIPYAVEPLRPRGALLIAQFLVLPGAALIGWLLPRARTIVDSLWTAAVVAALGAGAMAIGQVVVLGAGRAEGATTNAIVFGDLCVVLAGLAVALHQSSPTARTAQRDIWMTRLAVVFGLGGAVASGTRSALIAVPLLIAVIAWGRRRELDGRRLLGNGTLIVGASLMAFIATRGALVQRMDETYGEISAYAGASPTDRAAGSSIGARFEAWRAAFSAFVREPLSGVGWGNIDQSFSSQVTTGQRNPRIATFDHAHQQVLSAFANGGILGGIAIIAVVVVPAVWFVRGVRWGGTADRRVGTAGLVVVVGYAWFGLTEAVLENFVPVAFYALAVAVLLSQLRLDWWSGIRLDVDATDT